MKITTARKAKNHRTGQTVLVIGAEGYNQIEIPMPEELIGYLLPLIIRDNLPKFPLKGEPEAPIEEAAASCSPEAK